MTLAIALLVFSGAQAEEPVRPGAGLDLEAHRGKVVLVDFWASWCVPCRASFPWMDRMAREYADQGLVIIAVNVDRKREAANRFLGKNPHGFEILYDPEGRLAEQLGVSAMPTSFLHDREGRLVFEHSGFRLEETESYEQRIRDLLAGKTVATVEPEGNDDAGRGRVRPWERDVLARRGMNLDADALDMAWDDHIYFSKEASSGGRAFGGGGCGCN